MSYYGDRIKEVIQHIENVGKMDAQDFYDEFITNKDIPTSQAAYHQVVFLTARIGILKWYLERSGVFDNSNQSQSD